jgi:hypothetical protein
MMPTRFYVARTVLGMWLVCDRTKIKLHNDEVARFDSRKKARIKARELNGRAIIGDMVAHAQQNKMP